MKFKIAINRQTIRDSLVRYRWRWFAAVAVIAVYGAFGFWVAPGIVQAQVVKQLSAVLDRPVRLEEVRVNPFALSVTAENFAIEERDGSTLAGFDSLYVNFSLSSLVRLAWTFKEIRVTHPSIALVIDADGRFNFLQLGAPQAESPKQKEETPSIPRFVIGEFTVTNGGVGFEDRRGQQPFSANVDAISFTLRDFSTLPDDQGQHTFSAGTDLGERLSWRGEIGVNPLQSHGQLELAAIQVPRLTDYLLPATVKVSQGTIDAKLDYDVKLLPSGISLQLKPSLLALRNVGATLTASDTKLSPLNLEFSPVTLKVSGLAAENGQPASIEVDMVPNGQGNVSVRGTLGFSPLKGDLRYQVSGMALAPYQTFLEPYARLRLERGALQSEGRVELGAGKTGELRFTGKAAITDFSSLDPEHGQHFARWRNLAVDDIRFVSGQSLGTGRITAQDPYLRVAIDTNRVSNLQQILGDGKSPAPKREPATPAKPPAQNAPVLRTRIGLITIRNGSANFSDESLTPNFTIGMQELNGTVKGLSSENDARAAVSLRGQVDRYAPATIEGEINPLAVQAYTDITLRFENIELTTFTPYSGKFAGRRIEKGKLNLDLRYRLFSRELRGENKIILDQFTLGERVESRDALDLPLELAVAILRDPHGVIKVDMPVRGNLDDPDFGYGRLVFQALRNLIMKAVTAPFSLLAASLGGGEELGYVVFAPGQSDLTPTEQAKLGKLASALATRPTLNLEIRGATADEADRLAIATHRLLRRSESTPPGAPLRLSEQRRLLELYKEKFKDAPIQGSDEQAVEQARKKLAATVAIKPAELQELARNRGLAIGEYLVTRAKFPKQRVFLANPGTGATAASDGVHVEMKLGMR